MKKLIVAFVFVHLATAHGSVDGSVDEVLNRWVKLTSFRFNVAYRSRQLFRNMNQHTLAREIGINHSSVARIANGTQPLSLRIGTRLAERLDVPVGWLLGFDCLKEEFKNYDERDLAILRGAKIRSAETLVIKALRAPDPTVEPGLPLGCELSLVSLEALTNELLRRGYTLRKRSATTSADQE